MSAPLIRAPGSTPSLAYPAPPVDLRRRAVQGGSFMLLAQALKFSAQLGSTMVLARLLTPEDFGLIAMVAVVTGFVAMFKDLGLSMATVQRQEISHAQVSALFWINVALGVAVLGVATGLAPLVAWFYGDPRLTAITIALASAFGLSGLGIQHQALLKRNMRFGALASVEVGSLLCGIAAAILAALHGAGYWSLVILQVATAAAAMAGVWVLSRWRPGRPQRTPGVASLLSFGANLTGANLLLYLRRHSDNLLIGRFWGSHPLGLYTKAYQLLLLPVHQINAPLSYVAIPTLSRLQNDARAYRAYFRQGVLVIVTLGMPIVAFLFVAADKVILTVLGGQWLDSVPIFRALAPAAFLGTLNVATGWVYVSLGHTDRQLRWAAVVLGVTAIGFLIGVHWGALGVAVALSLTTALVKYPGFLYCFRTSPLRVSDVMDVIWRPAVASLAAAAATWWLGLGDQAELPLLLALGLEATIFAALYLGVWLVLPQGSRQLRGILALMAELWSRPSTRSAPYEEPMRAGVDNV